MQVTILTDNANSWIIPYVEQLKGRLSHLHDVRHIFRFSDIESGDVMFLLSCEKILPSKYLKLHSHNIVVHPSPLPQGKGHSPLAWQILEGVNKIPMTLFEAVEAVDAGDIYISDFIELEGHELNDEIKNLQGLKTIEMVEKYLENYTHIQGRQQSGNESFYPRRGPSDSKMSVDKTIEEQFDLLRVVDNERYPAFFVKDGHKYILKIYKDD